MSQEDSRRDPIADFVEHIRNESHAGFGIVPFLGAGISAASGILTGQNFTNYLTYTVFRCVASKENGNNDNRWDLKKWGWPKYPTQNDVEIAIKWIKKAFNEAICRSGCVAIYDAFDVKVEQVIDQSQEAIWRAAGSRAEPKFDSRREQGQKGPPALSLQRPLVPRILLGSCYEDELRHISLLRSLGLTPSIRDFQGEPGSSPSSEEFITERAIRSLHDWRATLWFLAELKLKEVSHRDCEVYYLLELEPAKKSVIDDFNAHITRGRKPNLTHHMFAHLSRPLRIRTILTTNFDKLLEEAFEDHQYKLTVLPVSSLGALPPHTTVRAENSLVKLHGERLETRADFTLDDPPTNEDKDHFVRYVMTPADHPATGARIVTNHLLVAGYSASDMRCVQFIKHLLDRDPYREVFIYWICHTEQDLHTVKRIFGEYGGRIKAVVTPRTDLLLYELYQRTTLSLPPGGFSFQFTHKVPPSHVGTRVPSANRLSDSEVANLCKSITAGQKITSSQNNNAAVLTQVPKANWYVLDGSNIIETSERLYSSLVQNGLNCIWIEMQDFADAKAVVHEILKTIAVRLGLFQLEHTEFSPHPKTQDDTDGLPEFAARLDRLINHFGIQPNRWVIFLYGRTVPGGCSGWTNDYWNSYLPLQSLLDLISSRQGFRIIYMPFSSYRYACHSQRVHWIQREICKGYGLPYSEARPGNADEEQWRYQWVERAKKEIRGSRLARKEFGDYHEMRVPKGNLIPPPGENRIHNIEGTSVSPATRGKTNERYFGIMRMLRDDWLRPEYPHKLQFLYGLCLFRHSRHPNAILTDAVFRCPYRFNLDGLDNDWERNKETGAWLQQLYSGNVLFLKPGGYAWMYRDVRVGLLRLIESRARWDFGGDTALKNPLLKSLVLDFAGQLRARMHYWIADWYFKAFCATGHVTPLVESLHHRFQVLRFCRYSKRRADSLRNAETVPGDVLNHRLEYFQMALCELIKTLRIARPWLRFWMPETGEVGIFARPEMEEKTRGGKSHRGRTGDPWDQHRVCETVRSFIEYAQSQDSRRNQCKLKIELLEQLLSELKRELDINYRMLHGETGFDSAKRPQPVTVPVNYDEDFHTQQAQISAASKSLRGPLDICFDPVKTVQTRRYRDSIDSWFKPALLNFVAVSACVTALDRVPRKEGQRRRDYIDDVTRRLASSRRSWTALNSSNQAKLQTAIQLLTDYAYLLIKRGKIEGHAAKNSTSTLQTTAVSTRYLQACVTCSEALRLCPLLSPAFVDFEISQKIKAQTLYSLSLGYLGRYFEAHRHLSEAQALLSKRSPAADPLALAIIEIRRAEIYLHQAQSYKLILVDKSQSAGPLIEEVQRKWANSEDRDSEMVSASPVKYSRLMCSAIDDAWVSLETAERHLSGRSHSSLWWGRLIALQLRTYALSADLNKCGGNKYVWIPLCLRRRVHLESCIDRLFNMGRLMSHGDAYRVLRLVDYYISAMETLRPIERARKSRGFRIEWNLLRKGELSFERLGGKSSLLSKYRLYIEKLIRTACESSL